MSEKTAAERDSEGEENKHEAKREDKKPLGDRNLVYIRYLGTYDV